MKPFGVVYLIINLINGKKYVGQTVQPLRKRFNKHANCKTMPIGRHGNQF
ncbi:MAG: GIY-YIG nuclease family protein [Selenomonadaceae bacterium]|nr:GIY-YIG nuclease family protein [Selenomonadaceae bacterium]